MTIESFMLSVCVLICFVAVLFNPEKGKNKEQFDHKQIKRILETAEKNIQANYLKTKNNKFYCHDKKFRNTIDQAIEQDRQIIAVCKKILLEDISK